MPKAKRIRYDRKTKRMKEEEFDYREPGPLPEPISIDLEDMGKLLDYAKARGWI